MVKIYEFKDLWIEVKLAMYNLHPANLGRLLSVLQWFLVAIYYKNIG